MSSAQLSNAVQNNLIQIYHRKSEMIQEEIFKGLLNPQAVASPKFLYNKLGSKIFEAICELPEYYLTRTEESIFEKNRVDIAAAIGTGCTLIDLGAGNCKKAESLFSALKPKQYVPVDISVEFLKEAVDGLKQRHPHIRMTGLGMDFSTSLRLPASHVSTDKRVFFYPGSSIGNYAPEAALQLLQEIRSACDSEGGLLIGVDLIKDAKILTAAYSDALGVTASFNLNILLNLNFLLGADFQIRDWQHKAFFNANARRVEMHLEARRRVRVSWSGGSREFAQGESLHTECSYKYSIEEFLEMLEKAGFVEVTFWTDPQSWFLVCYAKASLPFEKWN